ncbi:hypothetical protein [Niastella populi]|uniref:Uncharacterized protein n=1 Tax=Niastella populi TaxID=550983 RepID=A0A1V9FKW5_9BACT|nr:hypothetical protein [Niastella populi]OQP59019.1 hypothetical protein A4R26_21770 [Niastella populi]
MSIFPKRAIRGNTVTVHWNITLPAGMESAVCPFVRIGINSPGGKQHMLFEEHVLLLPSTAAVAPASVETSGTFQYLNKHTPLLVLASYLTAPQQREKLVEVLTNLQNGRHYYFSWPVPPDAAPGKYILLSEMYIDGSVKHSGTATEDFFYIEQLNISTGEGGEVVIHNPGPEPVPAKLITYIAGYHQRPYTLQVFFIAPGEQLPVNTAGKSVFLVYNEERITIPLHTYRQPRTLRNQQHLFLHKEKDGEQLSYVLPREGETAWRLSGPQREIWQAADGMSSAAIVREKHSAGYDEMLAQGLITEIP